MGRSEEDTFLEPRGQKLLGIARSKLFKIFCCAQVDPGRFIHMFTGLFCEEENAISENRKTCIGEKGWE